MSEAAGQTIITTEQLLPNENAHGTVIVRRSRTTAVVEAKYGAHPTGCFPHYRQDIAFLANYVAQVKERGAEMASRLLIDSSASEDERQRFKDVLVDL
jgi:hypothetical protein